MPEFKSREEYEKWKANRLKETKEKPMTTPQELPKQKPAQKQDFPNESAKPISEKKCPYCFTVMDARASVCPSCKKKIGRAGKDGVAQKYHGIGSLLGMIVAALFVLGIIGTIIGNTKNTKTETSKTSQSAACEAAKAMVIAFLKAPSTAKFANCAAEQNGLSYHIVSCVDSQNSFGAMLRNQYIWEGYFDTKINQWHVDYFSIGDHVYFKDGLVQP